MQYIQHNTLSNMISTFHRLTLKFLYCYEHNTCSHVNHTNLMTYMRDKLHTATVLNVLKLSTMVGENFEIYSTQVAKKYT